MHKEMFRKIIRIITIFSILFIIISPIFFVIYSNLLSISTLNNGSEQNQQEKVFKTADVAGTDLYAESIDAFVAGNKSVIKQSIFTNDTNILPHFDARDPAFYKCNLLFSASNGITPRIFPRVLNENNFSNQYKISFNGFSGFLFYDDNLTEIDAKMRADRALEIMRRKFQIDLIMVNVSEPNFFPFVGYYPNWSIFLPELTSNLPKDGYWKAFDINRLKSADYLMNYHISSTFFLLNSLDFFEKDIFKSIDQINFNLDSLDLSFIYNLEIENLFDQFTNLIVDFETIFGNVSQFIGDNQTISQEDLEEFSELFNILALSNESHYTTMMIQYEGLEDAIQKVGKNQYNFDLWEALNYSGDALRPSEKVFIALVGAFMSEIDINLLCTDIIDTTPEYFDLYEFLLEQIELILFYAGIDFDIDSVKDYSFELFWVDKGGIKQSYIIPKNLVDPTDIINYLPLIGIQGLPGIPTGIFNPIQNFRITYLINTSDSNILIRKELLNKNASFGVFEDFSFNITAENVGNETSWGIPTSFPLDLDDVFSIIAGQFADDFKDDMWDAVKSAYPNQYDSLEDFFNYDENPRIFYFDTLGSGLIDTYYPNINNISNLWPYNKNADIILNITFSVPHIYDAILLFDLDELKELFTNSYSIWNDKNWKLESGEKISYIYSNYSINQLDSYTEFCSHNFTIKDEIPQLPSIVSGIPIMNTNPYMALNNDNKSWIIQSEEKYLNEYDLEIVFLFQNQTKIDLINNTLDEISITINYTDSLNLLNLEVFNFTIEEYKDLEPYLISRTNNTATFSLINQNGNFDWIFDPYSPNNYTIIIRLKATNPNRFNISINDFDIHFSYRDINEYKGLNSRIIYTSMTGNVQYVRKSNSLSLSTDNMSSIIAFSHLSNYSLRAGDTITYTLYFENIGSAIAQNVNISILIPGIIKNSNNFTVQNNHLKYFLPELAPMEKKELTFTFYSPNSESIFSTVIKYKNPEIIQNLNSCELNTKPNEVFLSSFIDFIDYYPFVHSLEIFYNSSNLTPSIGNLFNISINVKNIGISKLPISHINFSLGDQFGDLNFINLNQSLQLHDIEFNNIKTLNILLRKEDWKGYYYPSINFISSKDSRVFQILSSTPIVLGNISFLIHKSVSTNQGEIGDVIIVTISVTNTGTICIKNITLSDIVSFNQIEFQLIEGNLVKKIECLEANETISISYKIRAKIQSIVSLKPASIEYYFLLKNKEISNQDNIIKIIIPRGIQFYLIFIPSLISMVILFYFLWQTHKNKSKKYEMQRNEILLFRRGPRDSILKIENRLKDYLAKSVQKGEEISEFTNNSDYKEGGVLDK